MKIVSIIGARPQFIKVKPIVEALKKNPAKHILIHTGQHYDYEMSQLFFQELHIPKPKYNLNTSPGTPLRQISQMLIGLERIITKERPDLILVYGDTTSTLAGSLAAIKLNHPLAHIEAGLRSYRFDMPEEVNRVITDRVADLLFCPTLTAKKNLKKEGITDGVHFVGDVMFDLFLDSAERIKESRLKKFNLQPGQYYLLTIHRQQNADSMTNLATILSACNDAPAITVFPVHPRTKKVLKAGRISLNNTFRNIRFMDPVGYWDTLTLTKFSKSVITDSGGVQKEAYFSKVPCVTLRDETEWIETLKGGHNILTGVDKAKILRALVLPPKSTKFPKIFGDGKSAQKIIDIIKRAFR